MEFQDLFARQDRIKEAYSKKTEISFVPRGSGNKQIGDREKVYTQDKISVAGETFSFLEFIDLVTTFYDAQADFVSSFEAESQVAMKEGPFVRFLGSSLFLDSLALVNPVSAVDAACRSAFDPSIFQGVQPRVEALDRDTVGKISSFFQNLDAARRVIEPELAALYNSLASGMGDAARTLNAWFQQSNKGELWQEGPQGWVADAQRMPDFFVWAAKQIPSLQYGGLSIAQEAALTKFEETFFGDKFKEKLMALQTKALGVVAAIVQRDVVQSQEFPLWFRIRVLLTFLQESSASTYAVRQNPDKRQQKSTSQYTRKIDKAESSESPDALDQDVPEYSENVLSELSGLFSRSFGKVENLHEAVRKDMMSMAISELLRSPSPANIFHGMSRRILNNFFIGGASAKQVNGTILSGFSEDKKEQAPYYKSYFSHKFFQNFVDYCSMIGFTGDVIRAYKTINAFMFVGKKGGSASRGAYATSVLFPVIMRDALVLLGNRGVELKEAAERKQETGFVAQLRSAIQLVGDVADVVIMDQQGDATMVYSAPWREVSTTGKNPDGSGGIEGVRDKAHADVMVFGQNKEGRPANFAISLKKPSTNYWGGTSHERSLDNQSHANRAKGYEGWSTTSEVDGFITGVRQAYALAQQGEKALSTVVKQVAEQMEGLLGRTPANNEIAHLVVAGFEQMSQDLKAGEKVPGELAGPLVELYKGMAASQGFVANQIKLEYRGKSFKQFRMAGGKESVVDGFWSMIYDREGLFRRALFGDLADSAKTPSSEESASHVIIGNPSIEVQGNKVVVSPGKGENEAVILSNANFKLHNPVAVLEPKEIGITMNMDFFKTAMPVLFASQSQKQTTAGIKDLYSRVVPLRRLVGHSLVDQVGSTVQSLFSGDGGKLSKEKFIEQMKKLSDGLAAPGVLPGKYRIEKRSYHDDVTKFVADYSRKSESAVELTVEVFLTLGSRPVTDLAKMAEVALIIHNSGGQVLSEEIRSVVQDILSEVFAKMPAEGPGMSRAASKGVDKVQLARLFQKQIKEDLGNVAKFLTQKIKERLPSLDTADFSVTIKPFEVVL